MPIQSIAELLEASPGVDHVFVASADFSVERLQMSVPRAQRRKRRPGLRRRWERAVAKLTELLQDGALEEAITFTESSGIPGIAYASTVAEADRLIDEFSRNWRQLCAIHEELISQDTLIVFLFKD